MGLNVPAHPAGLPQSGTPGQLPGNDPLVIPQQGWPPAPHSLALLGCICGPMAWLSLSRAQGGSQCLELPWCPWLGQWDEPWLPDLALLPLHEKHPPPPAPWQFCADPSFASSTCLSILYNFFLCNFVLSHGKCMAAFPIRAWFTLVWLSVPSWQAVLYPILFNVLAFVWLLDRKIKCVLEHNGFYYYR